MASKWYEITFTDPKGKQVTVDALIANFDGSTEDARAHYEREHPTETIVSFAERGDASKAQLKAVAEDLEAGRVPAKPPQTLQGVADAVGVPQGTKVNP